MNVPNKYETEINREALLIETRKHLFDLKQYEPRIISLTLYLKEEYGYSTLRVFLSRELREKLQQQLPEDVDLSFLTVEHPEQPNNEFIEEK